MFVCSFFLNFLFYFFCIYYACFSESDYVRGSGTNVSCNNPDVMSKLLQHQHYIQAMAAMRSGVQPGSWPVPPHLLQQWRAQTVAVSQADQQRLYALALMHNDMRQAQAIRARALSQQAAASGLLNANASAASAIHFQPSHVCALFSVPC